MQEFKQHTQSIDIDGTLPSASPQTRAQTREELQAELEELAQRPLSEATSREIQRVSTTLSELEQYGPSIFVTYRALEILEAAETREEVGVALKVLKDSPVTDSAIDTLGRVLHLQPEDLTYTSLTIPEITSILEASGRIEAARILLETAKDETLSQNRRGKIARTLEAFPVKEVTDELIAYTHNRMSVPITSESESKTQYALCEAIYALRTHDTEKVSKHLISLAEHEGNVEAKMKAILALGSQSSKIALEFLLEQVSHEGKDDGNGCYRKMAALALKQINPSSDDDRARIESALVHALHDPHTGSFDDWLGGDTVSLVAANSLVKLASAGTTERVLESLASNPISTKDNDAISTYLREIPAELAADAIKEHLLGDAPEKSKTKVLRVISERADDFPDLREVAVSICATIDHDEPLTPLQVDASSLLAKATLLNNRQHALEFLEVASNKYVPVAISHFRGIVRKGESLTQRERQGLERLLDRDLRAELKDSVRETLELNRGRS